ncbi:MAG: sigma-70 family RNA polymerase sigma factor [Myxococcales bacterium]|nr:sigma-70 family RNA polymerase sigma factor [Myxococcales bacterium]
MNAPHRNEFSRAALPHLDGLYAAAVRLTRSRAEAEDLVQDALVLAYQGWHRFEQGTNLRAWLHRIQVNAFISQYRKARRAQRVLDFERDPGTRCLLLSSAQEALEGPDGGVMRGGLSPTVQEALDALPEEFRTVVILSDIAELSYREIAEALGCPMGTVMSRLHRGRKALARRLGPVLGVAAEPTPEPALVAA